MLDSNFEPLTELSFFNIISQVTYFNKIAFSCFLIFDPPHLSILISLFPTYLSYLIFLEKCIEMHCRFIFEVSCSHYVQFSVGGFGSNVPSLINLSEFVIDIRENVQWKLGLISIGFPREVALANCSKRIFLSESYRKCTKENNLPSEIYRKFVERFLPDARPRKSVKNVIHRGFSVSN